MRDRAIVRRLLFVVLASAASRLAAQSPIAVGTELQINLVTVARQGSPSVAVEADGDFVVVWESYAQDGSYRGIFARRFTSSGAALGVEIAVNSYTSFEQSDPQVVAEANGDFVVVWTSDTQDENGNGVFGRRFDSAGTALGPEFQVNSYTPSSQFQPSIAMRADGGFVVAWASAFQDGQLAGIFARRFDPAGSPLAVELQINTYTVETQFEPAAAMNGSGAFVVVWKSPRSGSGGDIFMRRYDSTGVAQGADLQVNAYTQGEQLQPAAAMHGDGSFVVTWSSAEIDDGTVMARRFDAQGVPIETETRVNRFTVGNQHASVVAFESGGGFVVAWSDYEQDGSSDGIFARRFDTDGFPRTRDFQINAHTVDGQRAQTFAIAAGDDFVMVWESEDQDGDAEGVFARRFIVPAPLDVDGDGSTDALTDGLLTLRYHFGFGGSTLTTGAVSPGCTRCTPQAILEYLQSQD